MAKLNSRLAPYHFQLKSICSLSNPAPVFVRCNLVLIVCVVSGLSSMSATITSSLSFCIVSATSLLPCSSSSFSMKSSSSLTILSSGTIMSPILSYGFNHFFWDIYTVVIYFVFNHYHVFVIHWWWFYHVMIWYVQ